MLGTVNEGDSVGIEVGIVAGGDSECSEEDSESYEEAEEQAFAVLEFAEESEDGDNVEEANVESLISFVILFDLLISSVHVVILSGYLDRN